MFYVMFTDVLLHVYLLLQTQRHITSFMSSQPQEGAKLKSKRVKRILNRMRTDNRLATNPAHIAGNTSQAMEMDASNTPTDALSPKGKAGRGTQVKNPPVKRGNKSSVSEGGWIRPSVNRAPPAESEVVSKESDFGFDDSDSDDALLGHIDLEAIEMSAAQDVQKGDVSEERGQGHSKGQGQGRGQDHNKGQGRGQGHSWGKGQSQAQGKNRKVRKNKNMDSNTDANDSETKDSLTNISDSKIIDSHGAMCETGRKESSKSNAAGKDNKKNISDLKTCKPAKMSTKEHSRISSGLSAANKSQYSDQSSKVVRQNDLTRRSRGRKTQQTMRTVADVRLSESDSESD
jgi:hypothetical protein